MKKEEITEELFRLQDRKYKELQAGIVPTVKADMIIGVRIPEIRKLAKKIVGDPDTAEFLSELPHKYYDENQLHAYIISLEKDLDKSIAATETFLPFVDNWATCDSLTPKAFQKEPERTLPYIRKWLGSDKTYTVRFAIKILMQFFLNERFMPEHADLVADLRSEEYYINMMRAWYFATALAKQYDKVIPYLEKRRMDDWTHNKTIQKSIESFRVTDEHKEYLKTLKVK